MTFNTRQFIFDQPTGHLVQEASTLGYRGGSRLFIESHHTGRMALFVEGETVRDAEGDIQAWTFVPAPAFRNGVVKKVVVFND